jgi:hypothetical protein
MSTAIRVLLEHSVDYAGQFPPASLELPAAARNYAAYRGSADSWMLGRFVVGVAKLPELRAVIGSMRPAESPCPVTVVVPDAAAATSVMRGAESGPVRLESIEARARTASDVALVGRALGRQREAYIEVAIDEGMETMLDAVAVAKLRAKVRTGGLTSAATPAPAALARFLRACHDRQIGFKATAGLHHPLAGTYPLTGDSSAEAGPMFGFINVLLAAVLLDEGLDDAGVTALLTESDAAAFTVDDQSISWNGHAASVDSIRTARAKFARSFGSCCFREPVDELPFSAIQG